MQTLPPGTRLATDTLTVNKHFDEDLDVKLSWGALDIILIMVES